MESRRTSATGSPSVGYAGKPATDPSTRLHASTRYARPAAVLAAIGLLLLMGYQIALALGMHLAGWGGGPRSLPTSLRIGSAVSAVVFVAAALVILSRAGYWSASIPSRVLVWGAWIVVVLMALSALANFASSSNWERFLLAPSAMLLALLSLVVARGPLPTRR
jgi:hypothetical protein